MKLLCLTNKNANNNIFIFEEKNVDAITLQNI